MVDLTQSSAVQKLLGLGETEFAVVVILGDVPAPSPQSNHLDDLHAKFGAVPHISCSTKIGRAHV